MFVRARRGSERVRLALCGASGSGKTYSALRIAEGLGGRVALLDAERGSSELYAGVCGFDVWRLSPPYSTQHYLWALSEAGRQGYSVCIVDGLSPAWSGEGGILSLVQAARSSQDPARRGDPWAEANHEHGRLLRGLLESPCHVLVTLRLRPTHSPRPARAVSQGWPRLDQKPGLEYEFTSALLLDAHDHRAWPIKDRTGLFQGARELLSAETGRRLAAWSGERGAQESLREVLEAVERCASPPELRRLWTGRSRVWREKPWFGRVGEAVWARMQSLEAGSERA